MRTISMPPATILALIGTAALALMVAGAVFLMASIDARADDTQACMSPTAWVQHVADSNPSVTTVKRHDLSAEQVANFAVIYNSTPPFTPPITADSGVLLVGILSNGDAIPQALVGLFHNGCRVASLVVSLPDSMRPEPSSGA